MTLPYEQATSWAATITPEGKAFERAFWERPRPARAGRYYILPAHCVPGHAVEFGVNVRSTEDAGQNVTTTGPLVASSFRIRATGGTKRHWYGAVQAVKLDGSRTGSILLVPLPDAKKALKLAPAFAGRLLDRQTLTNFVWAIRSGDIEAILYLTDWLEEQGDMRGTMLRDAILTLAVELFPEVPAKKEDKQA
jgi:hypothetical protein